MIECISIVTAYTEYSIKVKSFLPILKKLIATPINGKYKKNLIEAMNNALFILAQSFFLLYHTYIL